ncbi:MAG: HAMP domain-containing histidine kinase [Acidimicrobiales bacterium]|nr:HAMP domain-containing histidine kinase [Acidimicrobiales bacterium]
MAEPEAPASPSVPNPAAERPGDPSGPTAPSAEVLSRPARVAVALAERLPDWAGSVRFRLTALYSLVLFALAAFLVAGLYAVLAARLGDERVYQTYQVTTVERVPGGVTLTPTEVRAEYRSVEALANERALGLLRSYSLTALVLLFFASMGVGWLVAGRVLAPIGRITGVAREIQATDLSRRIALGGPPDELRELADTFDAMLARLDGAFDTQQRFIQEASHELRNPLAVMRTNLEVALADPDADAAELRRVAELVGASAERMSTLVDDLLVYARLGAPARERGPVRLASLAADAAEELEATATERAIRLDVEDLGAPEVEGDALALRQAVANLLVNAVRLAPEGSTIWVRSGLDEGGAWVTVADEGPGIAPEDRPRVFERFWRGDKASARAQGRSGLGLAIVAQVAGDHGGTVHVDGNERGGSTFTLRFPAVDGSQEVPT